MQKTDEREIEVAPILPPLVADRVRMILSKKTPFTQRENARITLMAIRDEIDKALKKTDRDFQRRT